MQQQVAVVEDDRSGTIVVDEKLHRSSAHGENMIDKPENGSENAPLKALINYLQAEIMALKKKRAEEGKANEKVVSIFASREQAWKAEKRKFVNEQKRLWLELQKSFMEQEVLSRRTQHLVGVQGGDLDLVCEECEQQEEWLVEMKERIHEQEFVILATSEEVKAEQQEKNALAYKVTELEGDLCEVKEKLRIEVETRSYDVERHMSTLAELDVSYKQIEMDKAQALEEIENLQSRLADISQEKNHFEGLVVELSSEIYTLQIAIQEKDDIISAMLKKADTEVEEKHELERELAIFRAKAFHGEIDDKKWQKHLGHSSPLCMSRDLMKARRSFGIKTDSSFDQMKELHRLHDAEVRNLQSAFEVLSPKRRGLGDWLDLERARSKLEQRHLQEINAFERQLKARDERMEAFRQQLLAMESEAKTKEVQIESLRRELKIASEKNPDNKS